MLYLCSTIKIRKIHVTFQPLDDAVVYEIELLILWSSVSVVCWVTLVLFSEVYPSTKSCE
jgi:hypothetical protein